MNRDEESQRSWKRLYRKILPILFVFALVLKIHDKYNPSVAQLKKPNAHETLSLKNEVASVIEITNREL